MKRFHSLLKPYRLLLCMSALALLLSTSCAMYRNDDLFSGDNPETSQTTQSNQKTKLTKEEKKAQKEQKKAEKKAQKEAKKATGNSFRPN